MKIKRSPEPLLYIEQPERELPEIEMQEIFMTKETERNCLLCDIVKGLKNSSDDGFFGESEARDFSLENNHEILMEAESAASKLMNENRTNASYEGNVNVLEKKEALQKEPLDLNYDRRALQEMIAQYEMKRQSEIETRPQSPYKKHSISLRKAKPFKEMDINGKIEYLVHFPKLLPPVPCIFMIGNRSIRGFLLSSFERKIDIQTFDEKILTIPIHELKDIQMIGID